MPDRRSPRGPSAVALIAWGLVALAAAEFVARGLVRRPGSGGFDLSGPYAQAGLWRTGRSPFDWPEGIRLFLRMSGEHREGTWVISGCIYPPSACVLLAPFSQLPWRAAQVAWTIACVGLLGAAVAALARSARLGTGPALAVFLAVALGLAPLHTGLSIGQPSSAAVALAALAIALGAQRRDTLAGLMLGLSIALKPQIGGLLPLYPLVQGRLRYVAWTVAVVAALNAAGLAVPIARGASPGRMLDEWRANLRASMVDNTGLVEGDGGAIQSNLLYATINIHPLLITLTGDPALARLIAWAICGLGAVAALILARRPAGRADDLLTATPLIVVTLLASYHRNYDAGLLLVPLAWSIAAWRSSRPATAVVVFAAILPFLVPGQAALWALAHRGRIPAAISDAPWFQATAMFHQVWALLAILAASLASSIPAVGTNAHQGEPFFTTK
jgi:hypothetical protein